MAEHCCDAMRTNSRTHYKGVPEAEQCDAYFEWYPQIRRWLIGNGHDGFFLVVNFCPWCGTDLRQPKSTDENSK